MIQSPKKAAPVEPDAVQGKGIWALKKKIFVLSLEKRKNPERVKDNNNHGGGKGGKGWVGGERKPNITSSA